MRFFAIYLTSFLFGIISAQAQLKVNSNVDLLEFPNISFDINNRNPEFKQTDYYNFFNLRDSNEVLIDSVSMVQVEDTINYFKTKKCVLILVESINHPDRIEQINTFINAIKESLPNFVNSGDKILIADFNLREDNTPLVRPLHKNFTDDIFVLENAINKYDASKNRKTKAVSEIPGAILESIDLLLEVPVDYNKSILLLSEERTNSYSTQKSFVNVINIAKQKEVVINTIKYNRVDYFQHENPVLADQTYGERYVLKSSSGNLTYSNRNKQKESERIITSMLNNVVKRSKGTTARVTLFMDDLYKDGSDQQIMIKEINSPNSKKLVFKSPGNWYYGKIQETPLVTIAISILLLIIIIIILNKLKNKYQNNKKRLLEQTENQKKIHLDQQSEILNQKKEIESIKTIEKQRIDKLNAANLLLDNKKIEAKQIQKMKSIGNFPILKFKDSSSNKSYEINKPCVSFGRDKKSNDVYISNLNMSRNHFSIIFKDSHYLILDNDSTNGMIINGHKLKNSKLKNGDVIEIADATFTFYI